MSHSSNPSSSASIRSVPRTCPICKDFVAMTWSEIEEHQKREGCMAKLLSRMDSSNESSTSNVSSPMDVDAAEVHSNISESMEVESATVSRPETSVGTDVSDSDVDSNVDDLNNGKLISDMRWRFDRSY